MLAGVLVTISLVASQNNAFIENPNTKAFAENIISSCKDNMHCAVLGLDNLTKKEDRKVVLATFSDLVFLYDSSSYRCHETAHHLGMWLYGYTSDLENSLRYASQNCGGAVFHGVIQGYFMTEHFHNVDPEKIDIAKPCSAYQDNPNSVLRWQCVHGIGHGLAELYDYNITKAVNRCSEFQPNSEQLYCTGGVFMQNVVHYYEVGGGDFDKNDIFFPCDKVSIKYAPTCYHYHTSYMIKQNNWKIAPTFDDCDRITPADLVRYCYYGMGRLLEVRASAGLMQAIVDCDIGKQSRYHADCQSGMLLVLVNRGTDPDVGFKFCNLLKEGEKAGCYDTLGKWIVMFYSTPQEREKECPKAENEHYSSICKNASLDNSIL